MDSSCLQGKIGSAKSLEEIAMDLTEQGGSKISRLGDTGLKNNHIMASNGSLVSTGRASSCSYSPHHTSFYITMTKK